jgi:two-component system, cell cycle response regulator
MELSPDITDKLKQCELPSLPLLAQKIIRLTQNMSTDPNDIADLVKMDISLSASVLRVANSVAFGYAGKVSSINESINRIGIKRMRDMVLSVSLVQQFKNLKGIDFEQFWNHCLSVGLAAEIIAKRSQYSGENSEHIYTAGLLHKVGIILLAQNFPEQYQQVLDEVGNDEKDLWELEKSIIGITHNEASHFVFNSWKFPDEVSQTALYYNDPAQAPEKIKRTVYVVHIANFACLNQGVGVGIERFPISFYDEAWNSIGLEVEDIPELLEEVGILTGRAKDILEAVQ